MATETVPYGRVTQKAPAVAEVHIVWITAGLDCDGASGDWQSGADRVAGPGALSEAAVHVRRDCEETVSCMPTPPDRCRRPPFAT